MARMNLEQAKKYAEDLKKYIGETTEECSVTIEVIDEGETASIEVMPGVMNKSNTIYHCEEIVDFCRGRDINLWIGARDSGGYPFAFVHIF